MSRLFQLGSTLLGRLGSYVITKEIHRAADDAAVFLARDDNGKNAIIKSIRGHWRLQNEASVLKRYQTRSPYLRPLVDEIQVPLDPPSIVLRYLDNDLLSESNQRRLSRPQIKQVARAILEALKVLHKDGMVHTDIKLDNIFVNHGKPGDRFSEIQLGDCGGVVSQESEFAKDGHIIGAGFTRSPEATFQLPWGTATDIWSFGTAIISLLYGGGFHLFNPGIEGIKPDDEAYELTVIKRMHKFFGPYPRSYVDFSRPDVIQIINYVNHLEPPAKPFTHITPREVPPEDKTFLLRIMKLDPRDRPTACELLDDEWFSEDSRDSREPLPTDAV